MKKTNSTINRWELIIFVLFTLFSTIGCALHTETKISSRQDTAFSFPVTSIFVISNLIEIGNDEIFAKPFEVAILSHLKQLNIRAKVQTRNPLAVESDMAKYKLEIVKFNPKSVLVINPNGGKRDLSKGKIIEQNFKVGLFQYAKKKKDQHLIWHAEITMKPAGFFIGRNDYVSLAEDLVRKLKADGAMVQLSGAIPDARVNGAEWKGVTH